MGCEGFFYFKGIFHPICIISVEILQNSYLLFVVCNVFLPYPLATFKILSSSLVFSGLKIMSVFISIYPILQSANLLNLCYIIFPYFWKTTVVLSPNITSDPFSLFFYIYVRSFHVLLQGLYILFIPIFLLHFDL